jgi:hypothetical protein
MLGLVAADVEGQTTGSDKGNGFVDAAKERLLLIPSVIGQLFAR